MLLAQYFSSARTEQALRQELSNMKEDNIINAIIDWLK